MKKLSTRLLVLGVTAISAAAALAGNDQDSSTLKQISGYRQWTKVNQEAIRIAMPSKFDPSRTAV